MSVGPLSPPPRVADRVAVAFAGLLALTYLPLVVYRGAYLPEVRGDAQVFFRAAWAMWTGSPLYQVTDDHGWHYLYPPVLAVLMAPFANAPPGSPALPGALPYPAALALWYLIGVVALVAAVHGMARALERHALPETLRPGFWQQWWLLRLGPVLAFLLYVGQGLGRGQLTPILLLCMVGFLVLYVDRRPVAAGFALAFGIALKLFPAILVLIPLLRRDWRALWWIAAWSALLFFALPALLVGPTATIELYRVLFVERVLPVLDPSASSPIHTEVLRWRPSFVSIGATLARLVTGPMPRETPLPLWSTVAHAVASVGLVGLVAAIGHGRFWRLRGAQPSEPYALLTAGALLAALVPAVFVLSRLHYWTLALPLFMVLTADSWRGRGQASVSPWFIVWAVAAALAYLVIDLGRQTKLSGALLWLYQTGFTLPVMLVLIALGYEALARRPEG
jgi:hypothetical protein